MTKSTPELFVQSQFDLSALCSLECKDICRCSVIIQYNFYKSIWSILTIVQVLFLQQSPTPCKIKALSLTLLFSTLQKKSRISPNEKYHPQGQFDQYSKRWLTWFSRELVRSRLPPLSTLSARLPASPSSLSWDFLHFHIFLPKIILIYYFHSPTWVEPFLHLSLRILLLLSLSSEGWMFLLCLRIPLSNYY